MHSMRHWYWQLLVNLVVVSGATAFFSKCAWSQIDVSNDNAALRSQSSLVTNPAIRQQSRGKNVTIPILELDTTGRWSFFNSIGLLVPTCLAYGGPTASRFVITGRGGLPDNPSQMLSSDTVWSDLRPPAKFAEKLPSSTVATQLNNSVAVQPVEAQGWVINNKREIVLTATAPSVTPNIPWLTSASCRAPQKPS